MDRKADSNPPTEKEATAIGWRMGKGGNEKSSPLKQSKKNEVEDDTDTLTIGGVRAYFLISSHVNSNKTFNI